MREIDNKLNSVNFKGVQKPTSEDKLPKEQPQPQAQSQKEIKDLKNMPAGVLGKSQVAGADTIENDMKFLAKHPEIAKNLNDAIDEYAKTHTEEETLKFLDTAFQEFAHK